MEAKVRQMGDVTIIDLSGHLDVETAEPFRERCLSLIENTKVVFNLAELSFVGSTGIGAFVNTLCEISKAAPITPRFCNVKSEFKRVFKATDTEAFQVFETESAASENF